MNDPVAALGMGAIGAGCIWFGVHTWRVRGRNLQRGAAELRTPGLRTFFGRLGAAWITAIGLVLVALAVRTLVTAV